MLESNRKELVSKLPFFNIGGKQQEKDISILKSAKVNYTAYDTHLEPYIDWDIVITKFSPRNVYYVSDLGNRLQEGRTDRSYFDIE